GLGEELPYLFTLLFRFRGFGRPARRSQNASFIGNGLAASEDFLHEVPHRHETKAEPLEVGAPEPAELLALRRHLIDRAFDVDGGEICVDRRLVRLFGSNSPRVPDLLR